MRFSVSAASVLLAICAVAAFVPSAPAQDDRTFFEQPKPSRKNEPLVDISTVCPGVVIDLRYASSRNLTGKPIYPVGAPAMLRRGVAEQLNKAQAYLQERGFSLKVWDAYRPPWAQKVLWDAIRDPAYVVEPSATGSMHAWGVAVDVTLVDFRGREVAMPTDFDSFTTAARYDYRGKDPNIAFNLQMLKKAMAQAGFRHIRDEWWHYSSKESNDYGPLDASMKPRKQPPVVAKVEKAPSKPVAAVVRKPVVKPVQLAAVKAQPTPKPEPAKKPASKPQVAVVKAKPKPVAVAKAPVTKTIKKEKEKPLVAVTKKPAKPQVQRVAVAPKPPKQPKVKVAAAPKVVPPPKTKVAAVTKKTPPKTEKPQPEKRRVVRTVFPTRPGEQL